MKISEDYPKVRKLRHSLGMSKQGVYSRARSALKELEDMMEEDRDEQPDDKGT